MSSNFDESIPWTEHFVKYGFAVLRDQVSPEFIAAALERVRVHVGGDAESLPFDEWTVANVPHQAKVVRDDLLDQMYAQPKIRHIIDTMFGTSDMSSPRGWSGEMVYSIFVRPFDPAYQPRPLWGGHIDYGGNVIPAFGDAFIMQVCLRDTEPFGGNITMTPGSHKLVQQRAIEDPECQYPYDFADFPFTEPYEFVAKAGDVILMHHMSFHEGNPCGTRRPRIALHMQVKRNTYLTEADPANTYNSPWIESFTLNGRHCDPNDEQRYIDFCANKKAMWGWWGSEDGSRRLKIYTGGDGQLHAKIFRGDAEQKGVNARFDGQQLKFDQVYGDDPRNLARAVVEVDRGDTELLHYTVGNGTLKLRRTETFTSRLPG